MSKITVEGMTCNHCAMHVQKALEGLGLSKVKVDFKAKEASFDGSASEDTLKHAIDDAGYVFAGFVQ